MTACHRFIAASFTSSFLYTSYFVIYQQTGENCFIITSKDVDVSTHENKMSRCSWPLTPVKVFCTTKYDAHSANFHHIHMNSDCHERKCIVYCTCQRAIICRYSLGVTGYTRIGIQIIQEKRQKYIITKWSAHDKNCCMKNLNCWPSMQFNVFTEATQKPQTLFDFNLNLWNILWSENLKSHLEPFNQSYLWTVWWFC